MKARTFIASAALILCNPLSASGLDIEVAAEAAILMDADTGQILYTKRAHEPYYPASITKVATALLVLESDATLDALATATREAVAAISPEEKKRRQYRSPSHWLEFNSSHVGIKRGELLSVETLLFGLMLQSGNDAANVLAEHVAGTVPAFIEQLNARLRQLGCTCTHFTNPHGLHHPEHITCAHDMALVTAEALKHPAFRQIVASTAYEKPQSNLQPATTWMQKNQLVRTGKQHHYPKAIGVKTGFTQDAQGTLIAAAQDGGRTLIAVVLRCDPFSNTYADTTALFEAAFNEQPVAHCVLRAGLQTFKHQRIRTALAGDLIVETYPSMHVTPQVEVQWHAVEFPLAKDSIVGEVVVTDGRGAELARAPLLSQRAVAATLIGEIPLVVSSLPKSAKGGVLAVAALGLIWIGRRKSAMRR